MRTLYVTDLDGTLMWDDKTLSNEGVAILNNLLSHGIVLTYATARSLSSASEITKSIAYVRVNLKSWQKMRKLYIK